MNPLDQRWAMVRDRWPVRLKNGSGSVIPPFSLVLESSCAAVNNEQVHTVVKPNASSTDFNRNQYLVTGPFAIGSGSSCEGLGSTLAQPNYLATNGSASKGQIWGPKHSQFTAERYYYGFECLGGATTFNGQNIALFRWIGVHNVLGKIDDSSVSLAGTCTVSVYSGSDGTTDTSMNIASVRNRGKALTSLSTPYCMVAWNGEEPYLIWVAC